MEHATIFELQAEGFWATIDQTPNGYLITWGDYVANDWAKGVRTLTEVFATLAIVAADAQEGNRNLINRTLNEYGEK